MCVSPYIINDRTDLEYNNLKFIALEYVDTNSVSISLLAYITPQVYTICSFQRWRLDTPEKTWPSFVTPSTPIERVKSFLTQNADLEHATSIIHL